MTYEAWNNSYGFIRSDLINLTKSAFAAGAASRDAEIAELVAALKGFVNYPADDADYPPPYKAAHEALAKVRKP